MSPSRLRLDRFVRPSLVPAGLLPPDDLGRPALRSVRDRMVDLTPMIVAALLGLLVFSGSYNSAVHHVSDAQVVLDWALGAVACGALWWRRRFPIQIAVGTALVAAV